MIKLSSGNVIYPNKPRYLRITWAAINNRRDGIPDEAYKIFPGGLADAQYGFATMLDNGYGVDEDHEAALLWYKKAADSGHVGACLSLGYIYREGLGVIREYSESYRWYLKAVRRGVKYRAQINLGHFCRLGLGGDQSYSIAVKWYGDILNYEKIAPEEEIALVWEARRCLKNLTETLQREAILGNSDAEHAIGIMHRLGEGVEFDEVASAYWLSRAAKNGRSEITSSDVSVEHNIVEHKISYSKVSFSI